MTLHFTDARGYAVTGASRAALESYEGAFNALWTLRGDPLAAAGHAIREAPAFVAAHQLVAAVLIYSRDPRDGAAGRAAFSALAQLPMNEREAAHAGALRTAIGGDFAAARSHYDRLLGDYPRDALALWCAQVIDYYLGDPLALRVRMARALEHWSPAVPGYHAMLATLGFGLEESGAYDDAAIAARRALELEPLDLRAVHVLLHVFEMQARAEDGVAFMRGREDAPNHLWWHVALFRLQLGETAAALDVYDGRLRFDSLGDLIDASALLWRLWLAGLDVHERFAALAARWTPHAEDAYCAFNDVHAMMAFAGAGRWDLADRLLDAQVRRIEGLRDANHEMTRLAGLPVSRALLAFARGKPALAESMLHALPPVAHRLGGSHAQRDVLLMTRAAAAAAAGRIHPFRAAA